MTNTELHTLLALDRSDLPEDGGPEYNRLIFSRSPYLLQHSRNPVDWREWGPAAQQEARNRNLPLFVSIGYATCHWCHVMAHESFEDEEVADILNHAFVPVKVDREERPDLDEFCMAACQTLTGSGGWPLNCFLKPDGTPFYALTYLPREPRRGMSGFMELLENIAQVWQHRPEAVERNAHGLMEALERQSAPAPGSAAPFPDLQLLTDQAVKTLQRIYDPHHHGFGSAPKFPMPPYLLFLFDQTDATSRKMALATLTAMRAGGIWDQLGGGIHRYSTDGHWLVPHFEKMLYDQALVSYAALAACDLTQERTYLEMADNLLTFVLKELTAPEGGFYCGLDADSEGREGGCYVWRKSEIEQLLEDDTTTFCAWFGVTGRGNFEGTDEHVLFQATPDNPPPAKLQELQHKLLTARNQRPQPLRDSKILSGWNGLTIAALARGAVLTGNRIWLERAERAAAFITTSMTRTDGRLLRSWCHGSPSSIPAFLEDYGFLAWGLLELHRATGADQHLQQAVQLCREALRLFRRPDGRLYTAGCDTEQLPLTVPDSHDGVVPCGPHALAWNLVLLAKTTGEDLWAREAEQVLEQLLPGLTRQPVSGLWLLRAALMQQKSNQR